MAGTSFKKGQTVSFNSTSEECSDEETIPKRLKFDDQVLQGQSTPSHSSLASEVKLPTSLGSKAGNTVQESDATAVENLNGTCDDDETSFEVTDTSTSTHYSSENASGGQDLESPNKPAITPKIPAKKTVVKSAGSKLEPPEPKWKTANFSKNRVKIKTEPKSKKRKQIRQILTATQLEADTLAAQRDERERIERINAKRLLQHQYESNRRKLSSAASTSNGPMTENDKLYAPKALSIDSTPVSRVIEEVTLSSDDEPAPVEFKPVRVPLSSSCEFIGGSRSRLSNTFQNPEPRFPRENSDAAYMDEFEKKEKHVNDQFGNVLVNVAHPASDPDIYLAPQIASTVKRYQIEGVRFLYDNVVESVDRFNTSNGFGCILAHAMGLGKTIQAVAFCDILLRHTSAKTVLIIVPVNTIQNWLHEFNHWIPLPKEGVHSFAQPTSKSQWKSKSSNGKRSNDDFNSSMSGKSNSSRSSNTTFSNTDDFQTRNFEVFVFNETVKTLEAREKIIREWKTKGGVLLLGYEMYRILALKQLKRSSNEEESLSNIHRHIVNPGPDLVICDEGHRIKNPKTSISKALKAIQTKRRVVLTGYPLQNNLIEYWCMVDFVRPNYLGTMEEFRNMFANPIKNGQCQDSSMSDKQLMRYRSHVLYKLLETFVQRRSHLFLQSALPPKNEWVILLKMTPIQCSLYKEFTRYFTQEYEGFTNNPIISFSVLCKIWNHPDVLYNVVTKQDDVSIDDLDLDEIGAENGTKKAGQKPRRTAKQTKAIASKASTSVGGAKRFTPSGATDYSGLDPYLLGWDTDFIPPTPPTVSRRSFRESSTDDRSISLDWAIPVFEDYESELVENGVKFQLLLTIVDEVEKIGDKLLVFSQSLLTLDLIELFFGTRLYWTKNVQYFRLDGSTSGLERERLIRDFNSKDTLRVFLVSTRAGSLGINLIGANRVVVFDACWNPCHDAQATCRVYRYGQKKECQIYRFVTDATLEKRIFNRQINKRGMADRVVDEMNPETNLTSIDVQFCLDLDQEQLEDAQKAKYKYDLTKFSDPVLQSLIKRCGNYMTTEPFEHESLLMDEEETRLSAQEKRQARINYERAANKAKAAYQNRSSPTDFMGHYSNCEESSSDTDADEDSPVGHRLSREKFPTAATTFSSYNEIASSSSKKTRKSCKRSQKLSRTPTGIQSNSYKGMSSKSASRNKKTRTPFKAGANISGKRLVRGGSDQSTSTSRFQYFMPSETYSANPKDMAPTSSAKTHSNKGRQSMRRVDTPPERTSSIPSPLFRNFHPTQFK